MLSVKKRLESVSQPSKGYVPKSLFEIKEFDDGLCTSDVNGSLSSIQGMAVDYLTRFMLTDNKLKSFDISLKGAIALDAKYNTSAEYEKALGLIASINGLDKKSVVSTCKLVCYDVAFRRGVESYRPSDSIEFDEALFSNIPILVNRCLTFLKSIGEVVMTEFTFEGGYTDIVSKGDGDFLTQDTLIDIKVSKDVFSTKWSLQLLMYYLLGIHSIHTEFSSISKLCIFNPHQNKSYICRVEDISDESKYKVSHDVLGYKMRYPSFYIKGYKSYDDYSKWREVEGSDRKVSQQWLTDNFERTNFKIENYGNGIFDITIEDYWTYIKSTFSEYMSSLRPLFSDTAFVKLIKNNGYYMFVSVSTKGKLRSFLGAQPRSLKYSLEYYYDNIERYASTLIMHFSKYWDTLKEISEQIKSLAPTESYIEKQYKEYVCSSTISHLDFNTWFKIKKQLKLSGNIHGCIVDIDFYNHIYVNPYDGTVVPYFAYAVDDKDIYPNILSLLEDHHPERLQSFNDMVKKLPPNAPLIQNQNTTNPELINKEDSISTNFVKVYDTDMYKISKKIKPLQNIYDLKLVQVWYDEILNENKALLDSKYLIKNKKAHKSISKNKNKDVGNIKSAKNKYLGLTKMMNCGLKATVIEYKDYTNLTIQFEDGVVKHGVRSYHFIEGKVSHPKTKK